MQLKRRTPCVGICSTTYGDLVCRGCKRFAHEIVQWNGYNEEQQQVIWGRLSTLRDEVVAGCVHCFDQAAFKLMVDQAGLADAVIGERIYQLLRFMIRRNLPLADAGLAPMFDVAAGAASDNRRRDPNELDTLSLMQGIDAQLYERSKAHYERNYRVLT